MFPISALDLLKQRQERGCALSLGDSILDISCGGGIFTNCITEISGEAGAGKTQLCLVLALRCYLDRSLGGLGGSAIYLCCGEGAFPDRRLDQLAHSLAAKYQHHASARPITQRDFLNNVHVLTVHHTEQALEVLGRSVPDLCQKQGVRLLIVDSLAGMARTEFDSSQREDMKRRTTALFHLAAKLKWLADTFSLCVVVVNQVTAAGFDVVAAPAVFSDGQDTKPALGLVWSTCVNTRILLRRGGRGGGLGMGMGIEPSFSSTERADVSTGSNGPENQPPTCNRNGDGDGDSVVVDGGGPQPHTNASSGRRTLHLELSPSAAPAACTYTIASEGVFGVNVVWAP